MNKIEYADEKTMIMPLDRVVIVQSDKLDKVVIVRNDPSDEITGLGIDLFTAEQYDQLLTVAMKNGLGDKLHTVKLDEIQSGEFIVTARSSTTATSIMVNGQEFEITLYKYMIRERDNFKDKPKREPDNFAYNYNYMPEKNNNKEKKNDKEIELPHIFYNNDKQKIGNKSTKQKEPTLSDYEREMPSMDR